MPNPKTAHPPQHVPALAVLGRRAPRHVWRWLIAAAGAVVFGIAAFYARQWLSAERAPSQPQGVGYILSAAEAVWADEGPGEPGDRFEAGRLRLAGGTVRLQFDCGAAVELVGPADATVVNAAIFALSQGKATVDIAAAESGFTIGTPHADIVAGDARFGVETAVAGEADVVVFQGRVELLDKRAAGEKESSSPLKALAAGDAVRVRQRRHFDRIVYIECRADSECHEKHWSARSALDPRSAIAAVRDNVTDSGMAKCYRIVPRGLVPGAPAYVDRGYRWIGADGKNLPPLLGGADLLMTFNDDGRTADLELAVTLARPGKLFVFTDGRVAPPDWLAERGFRETGLKLGLDESVQSSPGKRSETGAGRNVDRGFSVWQADIVQPCSVLLGGNRGKSMYGVAAVGETVRVACVGDSITAGSGHVGELQRLLGDTYDVQNFGVSSTTLLSRGERPYVKENKCRDALEFKPHVAVVMLGTNDTKPENYKYIGEFAADYKRLVAEFAALPTKPRIFLCTPPPVYYDGNGGIDAGRLDEGVLPGVREVAEELKLPVIDMHEALSGRPDLFYRDNVHPVGGQTLMAAEVYRAITGREAPIARQPPPPALTRVACLGDSITEGSGYPETLQRLLGNKYVVRNFGVSGATLLADGDRPYRKQSRYRALKDFDPQMVLVMLGTNDTKPQNFKHLGRFEQDCRDLLDDLAALPAKPKVFLCKPVPVYGEGNWGIDGGRLTKGVIPHIEAVARDKNLPLIDMYAALSDKPQLFKDNVHPVGGQLPMARAALPAIRQEWPSPPAEENLLRNPGIEAGLEPWIARGGTPTVVDSPVKAGRKALKLTGRKAHWHGPGQEVKEQLLKRGAGYYDVRAAVRLPAGGSTTDAVVVLMLTDDAGTRYLKTTSRPVADDDWTDFDDQLFIAWTGTLRDALWYVETLGELDDQLLLDECGLSRIATREPAAK